MNDEPISPAGLRHMAELADTAGQPGHAWRYRAAADAIERLTVALRAYMSAKEFAGAESYDGGSDMQRRLEEADELARSALGLNRQSGLAHVVKHMAVARGEKAESTSLRVSAEALRVALDRLPPAGPDSPPAFRVSLPRPWLPLPTGKVSMPENERYVHLTFRLVKHVPTRGPSFHSWSLDVNRG